MSVCPACGAEPIWDIQSFCDWRCGSWNDGDSGTPESFRQSTFCRKEQLERQNRALWNILRRSGNPDRPGWLGYTDEEIRERVELELKGMA